MRTLICEGIETFIVEESQLLFLGLEVFSAWDSSSNNPKHDGQIFQVMLSHGPTLNTGP